jgi:TRAP-type C4-dicarboxylate transport system substrate-binding protein
MKRKHFLLIIGLILSLTLTACGSSEDSEGPKVLQLAHTQASSHPVHVSMEKFAELVAEKTNGEIEVEIFPNGVLGDERKYVENIQAGTLDMAKVSVNSLENFDDVWSIFAIPYVFEGVDHGTSVNVK